MVKKHDRSMLKLFNNSKNLSNTFFTFYLEPARPKNFNLKKKSTKLKI